MSRYKELIKRIEDLETQLEEDMYDVLIHDRPYIYSAFHGYNPYHLEKRPTFRAKINALLEHAKLEVSVTEKKCIEPKIVVEKGKK